MAPALDIEPDPGAGGSTFVAVAVLAVTSAVLVVTVALFVPAWQGRRWASVTIAGAQAASILTALPAFFAPAGRLPPGGVILSTIGSLFTVAVVAMILSDASGLVLTALAVIVTVALYSGLVELGELLVPPTAIRLVQTLVAVALAVSFAPLVRLLRRTIGRAAYGGRVEPATTALRIGRRALDGADALTAAVQDAAVSLRFPRIELWDADPAVSTGTPMAVGTGQARASASQVDLPLEGSDPPLRLRVTLRRGERTLHRDDRAALSFIALPLVLLARESALLSDVRRARAALANAREREQLALHRELHDGLGPLLTGAVMRADAARNLLPDTAGLWPTELEQRGLRAAIVQRASRAGVAARIPDPLPTLPPALELALYRIACEAIANIERHAPGAEGRVEVDVGADAATLTAEDWPGM